MEKTDINRRLHEALGRCWHMPTPDVTVEGLWLCKFCGKNVKDDLLGNIAWPDYCSDPRLVIAAMRENPEIDFDAFLVENGAMSKHGHHLDCILDFVMGKDGELAEAAIEWLKQEGGNE